MKEKNFSFRQPIWLVPASLLVLLCTLQTLHLTAHSRYCKTDAEWRSIYDQRNRSLTEEE
ncbi:MAG: hypothetical protein DBW83_06770 [Synechococcus sp. MED-G69]|jgi:hypothetical protein|nr:MAG: hypothetical protein DBW83_06770 [Synechococcus sp. MED-G69]